jgi:hypothetical protein
MVKPPFPDQGRCAGEYGVGGPSQFIESGITIAFAVENVTESLKHASNKGVQLIDETPRMRRSLMISFIKSTLNCHKFCGKS